MQLDPATSLRLQDSRDHTLGEVLIERLEGPLLLGKFTPGPDYPAVQHLFHEFEEMVTQQVFPLVDELGAAIDALQLRLSSPDDPCGLAVCEVQIMQGEDFSCRLNRASVEGNGSAGAKRDHSPMRMKGAQ